MCPKIFLKVLHTNLIKKKKAKIRGTVQNTLISVLNADERMCRECVEKLTLLLLPRETSFKMSTHRPVF